MRRKHDEQELGDARILGSSQFVQDMLAQAHGMVKYQITAANTAKEIDRELEKLCQTEGITKKMLQSGSRRHPIPKVRKKLASQFIMDYGLSLAETARQLGVSTSAIARMLERN